MNATRLVARRELRERLRAKSFYVLTGILVLVILAAGVVARVAQDDGPGTVAIGVVGGEPGLLDAIQGAAADLGIDVTASEIPDTTQARAEVEDGDLDVALVAADEELLFDGVVDERAAAALQLAWSATSLDAALREAGVDPATVADVLAPAPLTVVELGEEDEDEVDGIAVLAGTVTAIMLFVSLQTFGSYVLMGVVEEKATAVVEVLLVRIRPVQLMAGKIIGIGVAALAQFAIAVGAGVVALMISGTSVPSEIYAALPTALLWFVGGYALYSTLFALAGSLVSRQEDAQAASAPITTVLIVAYMAIYAFGYVPKSTASRVLSVIPPFAPFSMPMRMAAGAASILEIVLALVLLVATIVGIAVVASRIYAEVLLRRGTRISWREALRTLRSPSR